MRKNNTKEARAKHVRYLLGIPYALYAMKLQDYDDKLIIANSRFTAEAITEFIDVDVKVVARAPPVPSILFSPTSTDSFDDQRENLVATVSRFSPDKVSTRFHI